jgi:IS1 family transposase
LFGARLPQQEIFSMVQHLAEGDGIRKTARLTGHGKDTVLSWLRKAGTHAKDFHNQKAQHLDVPEVQLDEKWAFVEKKQDHLTPEEVTIGRLGDDWDHVAFAPQTDFVVSLVCGKRTLAQTRALLSDFKARAEGRLPELITSDELSNYEGVILETYGQKTPRERNGTRGRFPYPILTPPPELVYALLHKHRRNGRVEKITVRQVFGTPEALAQALARSPVSTHVNTSFIERYNGTDRHRNSRKVRKTYAFSKDREIHEQASWLSCVGYNFCHAPRTRTGLTPDGQRLPQSPAMLQGLTDHVWSVGEILRHQIVPRE